MAPPLQVTNAGLLRLIWSIGPNPYAVNVFGIMGTAATPPTTANVTSLQTAILAAHASSALNARQAAQVSLSAIGVRSIHAENLAEIIPTITASPGTGTTDMLPANVALCVTLRTAFAGRRFRGRSYLPGFTETENIDGFNASAAATTSATSFITSIRTALQTATWDLAVVSRPVWTEVLPPTVPPVFVLSRAGVVNAVTLIQTRDAIWDTQRRRLISGI